MLSSTSVFAQKKQYEITFKVKGLENKEVFMGFHLHDKQYIKDTARADSKGKIVFKGEEQLEGGIYLFITPDKRFFEFLVDRINHKFTIETDTLDFVNNLKTDDKLNGQFNDYQKKLGKFNKNADPISKQFKRLNDANPKSDSIEILKNQLRTIDKDVKAIQLDFINNNPGNLLTNILNLTREVNVPDAPTLPNGRKDSLFQYQYYKNHYFDYYDFNDDRLVRTPILGNKVFHYFDKVVIQNPDSIVPELKKVLAKTQQPLMYKFLTQILTNHYETSKIMGMDAVTIAMYKNIYLTGKAPWADSSVIQKVRERVKKQEPLLIGKQAPNLILKDTFGVYQDMYKLPSKYILLVFWDPDCGHCKKELPFIVNLYAKLKAAGIEVYSATPEVDDKRWKKGINELKLPFLNVADIELHNYFRTIYDLETTPQIYFLDENRIIRGKKLNAEYIDVFLKNVMHIEL
jgi:thiol-disulfide isomerase/thioredoxin